ncbi:AAA family ATPase [Haliovirga abyssi]|uniref:AAA-ATPase-like domain-containing protein n=1 Tax=Haliovirga abyssi TaxID=2996794 RepID=A0AAU9D7R1_9FUSO|nr:AAA family ATPase [Haliovirga abyssi]BDU49611.1 hypothetical protein HLVA_01800 [Haliovirga abyssi]
MEKNKKKRLPIGISDFKTVIEKDMYYVDKSMFIKDVIDSGQVILITRPRRFGKTLNQSMMKYFFNIQEENSELFKNLKIYKDKEIIEEYMNKYPVIYLTFKDMKALDIQAMMNKMKMELSSLYIEHDYLLNDKILKDVEKNVYNKIMNLDENNQLYESSIKKLSEYMYRYYRKKVILIIDEYDTAIQQSYLNGYYKEFIMFMSNLLGSGLKDNKYLEKGVLTGITRVSKESIFTGVNNLKVSTILDELFNDKFGMLKEEMEDILKYYNLEYEEKDVMTWYDGYNFGRVGIYNPFSIINLVDNKGKIKPYWVNTSGNKLIKDLIRKGNVSIKKKIELLLSGETIESSIEEAMIYNDLSTENESYVWTLFLFSGYLKWVEKVEESIYKLKIPNKETEGFYRKILRNILDDKNIDIENILEKLILGKIKGFKKDFKKLVMGTLSYFDVKGDEPERFYHGLILGMIVSLNKKYVVKSNRESGLGRADLLLIPRDKKDKGIVIEFKKYDEDVDKDLVDSAKRGIKQIEFKKYEEEIKSYGVEEVIKVGIAFEGKELEIVSNLENIIDN